MQYTSVCMSHLGISRQEKTKWKMFMRSKLIFLHVCSWFDVAIRKFIIKNSSSKCWLRFHLPLWRNNFPLQFRSSFNFHSFPWLGTSTFKKKVLKLLPYPKRYFLSLNPCMKKGEELKTRNCKLTNAFIFCWKDYLDF